MDEETLQKELENIFESWCETAKGFFYTQEEVKFLIFIFHMQKDRLALSPIIPSQKDKNKLAQTVQSLCKKLNAVAGIVVGESWIVKVKKDEIVPNDIVPSKRSDRIEALQVTLVSRELNKVRVWKIIREGKKHLEPLCDGDLNPIYSKFFGDYFSIDVSESEEKETYHG